MNVFIRAWGIEPRQRCILGMGNVNQKSTLVLLNFGPKFGVNLIAMNHKLLKQKYAILGVFLGTVFMYLAFRKVDVRDLEIKLKAADLTYMFLALLPLSASYITRTFLWQRIISTFKNVDFSSTFS